MTGSPTWSAAATRRRRPRRPGAPSFTVRCRDGKRRIRGRPLAGCGADRGDVDREGGRTRSTCVRAWASRLLARGGCESARRPRRGPAARESSVNLGHVSCRLQLRRHRHRSQSARRGRTALRLHGGRRRRCLRLSSNEWTERSLRSKIASMTPGSLEPNIDGPPRSLKHVASPLPESDAGHARSGVPRDGSGMDASAGARARPSGPRAQPACKSAARWHSGLHSELPPRHSRILGRARCRRGRDVRDTRVVPTAARDPS